MRTTIKIAEDALLTARNFAQRERLSFDDAVSELIRRGATSDPGTDDQVRSNTALRGRFILLPPRDEALTPQKVRELMVREGI